MAADRRLLVPARRNPDRRLLAIGRTARGAVAARPGSVRLSRARINPAHRHPRRRVDRLLRRRMLAGGGIAGHLYRPTRLCKGHSRAWPDLERLWRMDG